MMQRRRRNNAPSVFPPRNFPLWSSGTLAHSPASSPDKIIIPLWPCNNRSSETDQSTTERPSPFGRQSIQCFTDKRQRTTSARPKKLIHKILTPHAFCAEGSNIIASTILHIRQNCLHEAGISTYFGVPNSCCSLASQPFVFNWENGISTRGISTRVGARARSPSRKREIYRPH